MRIAVIGAGRMGAIRVEDLAADPRVDEVLVANRTPARAVELAGRFGATPVPWADATATGADATIVAVGTDAHAGLLDEVLGRAGPCCARSPSRSPCARPGTPSTSPTGTGPPCRSASSGGSTRRSGRSTTASAASGWASCTP